MFAKENAYIKLACKQKRSIIRAKLPTRCVIISKTRLMYHIPIVILCMFYAFLLTTAASMRESEKNIIHSPSELVVCFVIRLLIHGTTV